MAATSSQKVELPAPWLQRMTVDWSEPSKRLLFPTSHGLSQRHVINSGQLDLRGSHVGMVEALVWEGVSALLCLWSSSQVDDFVCFAHESRINLELLLSGLLVLDRNKPSITYRQKRSSLQSQRTRALCGVFKDAQEFTREETLWKDVRVQAGTPPRVKVGIAHASHGLKDLKQFCPGGNRTR